MDNNNSSKLVVHIGFGKTSTSKLQVDVFPAACEMAGFKYWGSETGYSHDSKLTDKFIQTIAKMWLDKPLEKITFQDQMFISNEGLSSYRDAARMLEYADKNFELFGKDAHIILTIREPRSWLTSVYMQRCIHEKPILEPNDFFLNDDEYSIHLPDAKFNVDKFDYIKIINKYRRLFKRVTVVKYEEIEEMKFLNEFFRLTDEELNHLRFLYNKKSVNKALGINSIKIMKKFAKLLNLFHLSHKSKYNNQILLKRISPDFLLKHEIRAEEFTGIRKIRFKFSQLFYYKIFFSKIIDKIMPYKKFKLDFNKIKKININYLENQYKEIPSLKTYFNKKL